MTLARRIDALDANLTPTQLVLRWLDEAHGYGSLDAYVRATLERPAEEQALNRLCREAHAGARARLRGKPPEQVHAAVRTALKGTVFRFLLVTRVNVAIHELVEHEALLSTLFAAQVGVLVSDNGQDPRSDPVHGRRLGRCAISHSCASTSCSPTQRLG